MCLRAVQILTTGKRYTSLGTHSKELCGDKTKRQNFVHIPSLYQHYYMPSQSNIFLSASFPHSCSIFFRLRKILFTAIQNNCQNCFTYTTNPSPTRIQLYA